MSEEVEMTPIAPGEGGGEPPKVAPSAVAASAAPTVKLKPVIRKPMIRKPVIGGAKPVTLKPAAGTPPPPAAVPEAAAEAKPAAPAAPAPAAGSPQLKSITSPIAAQAILHKTGIIAEGILTPAQAQAAKTKTSRISLESAIGVAPTMKSAAPMKTIRLRRPTDIPAAGAAKPLPSALKPETPAAPAPAPAAAPAPAQPAPAAPAAEAEAAAPAAAPTADETPSVVTQKKTLKLKRPGFKRPTVSGLHRPGEAPAAPADGAGDVADLSTVADIPDIKPLPTLAPASDEDDSKTVAGVPAWLNVTTLVAGIAALIVIGLCTWTLFCEAVGPAAGPNDLASFHSDTDYRR